MDFSHVRPLLCFLGAVKEFRPSEPFLSAFLNGPKNFTEQQINNDIYPVGTYSNMALLVIVLVLTDWLRYKPIIILQALSGITTYCLLIWGPSLALIQLCQVSYGLFAASEIAYSSYLYAKLDKSQYRKAATQTKAAILVGKTGSGIVGQLLFQYHVMDLIQLNYLNLAAFIIVTMGSLLLPPVERTSHQKPLTEESPETVEMLKPDVDNMTKRCSIVSAQKRRLNANDANNKSSEESKSFSLKALFNLWINAMKNKPTLKWSIWSALSFCIYLQVSYYIQLLWQDMINAGSEDQIYHGFSMSFNSLAGALCTYAVGFVKVDWTEYGEVIMAVSSAAQGGLLALSSYVHQGLITQYAIYALFKILYQASTTIVSAEIARSLESESYGLVFGANQFLALVVQSILTVLVTKTFYLHIRWQFLLYGCSLVTLGLVYFATGVSTLCHFRKLRQTARQNKIIINS